MFEKASRLRLRFDSPQGALTVEDLWELPLTSRTSKANLNDVARSISRQLKTEVEEDFVAPAKNADEVLQLKLDIAKHIIHAKQAENEAARTAEEKRERKARIMELIAQKEDQELLGKSREELAAMVQEL